MNATDEDRSQASFLISPILRFFGFLTASLFAFGLINAWNAGLGFLLLLPGLPILLGLFVVGSIAYTIRGIKAALKTGDTLQRAKAALAAPLMSVLTAILAWPALASGNFTGTWTRLMWNRSHYQAIIAEAQRSHRSMGEASPFLEDGGVEYIVDAGPPVRVAFNPEGMLDNWSGIVFDPTGEVMLAKGFDPVTGKFVAPDRITKIFGGDLVGCRHLWGHYYSCSFT